MKSPTKPKKGAEQIAAELRNRTLLDETIMENEKKFKALGRSALGRVSFLSGAPATRLGSATRPSAKSSMLGASSSSVTGVRSGVSQVGRTM